MADSSIPPPLPKQPFAVARDEITAPGIGEAGQILALQKTLRRVRGERDDALSALRDSVPPDPTRAQKLKKLGLTTAQVTMLTAIAAAAIPIIEKKWPAYAEIIRGLMQNLGWQ